MLVTAILIDEYNGYAIHGYPRAGTGGHGNDYVKIKKGKGRDCTRGKFKFTDDSWETRCSLDASIKAEIKKYLLKNKLRLQAKIKELG